MNSWLVLFLSGPFIRVSIYLLVCSVLFGVDFFSATDLGVSSHLSSQCVLSISLISTSKCIRGCCAGSCGANGFGAPLICCSAGERRSPLTSSAKLWMLHLPSNQVEHTHTHTHTHARAHNTDIHADIHTPVHTYIHTYIHTYVRTVMHTPTLALFSHMFIDTHSENEIEEEKMDSAREKRSRRRVRTTATTMHARCLLFEPLQTFKFVRVRACVRACVRLREKVREQERTREKERGKEKTCVYVCIYVCMFVYVCACVFVCV